MPGTAKKNDVAIVGGGIVGLALARELARAGVSRITLFESLGAPGQGSTSRANGGVRAQFTTRSNIEFSLFTVAELETLQEEERGLPGFIQAGYLLFTGTEKGEAGLRAGFELQKSCGVEVAWLAPEEVFEKAPYIRKEGVRAGTFCAKDGLIDPGGIVQAVWNQVKNLHVDLRLDTRVTGLQRDGEGFLVTTDRGSHQADWVINAAGPEARQVAALLGVDLPVHPVRRNLACTEPVTGFPNIIPMCVDLDTGVLIRKESGGFLIAYSNPKDPPGTDISLDPNFLPELAERIGNRFPFLEEVEIPEKKCWAGLYPETPDHHAIVGPTPEMPRFLHAVGFGGHGIMHSFAAARALTEVITVGQSTTLDIHPLRFERFAEGDLIVETAVL